jgi:hypothetical protein
MRLRLGHSRSIVHAAAFVTLWANRAHAQTAPEALHRVGLAVMGGPAYLIAGSDGRDRDKSPRAGARVLYAYRPVRGFEVGADLGFLVGKEVGVVVLPAGTARGFVGIGARDPVELGGTAHVGAMVLAGSSNTWMGWAVTAGPNVRIWVSDDIALQLAGEATLAVGYTSQSADDPYATDAEFLMLAGSAGILWRL